MVPTRSRRTTYCGWMTRWMSCWLSARAIETESTRNGMSSVTTSTTVCPPADQPLPGTLGVNTLIAALPWGRSPASRSTASTAP